MCLSFKKEIVCCGQKGISSMEGTKAQVHSLAGLCQGQVQTRVLCAAGCNDLVELFETDIALVRLFCKAGRR